MPNKYQNLPSVYVIVVTTKALEETEKILSARSFYSALDKACRINVKRIFVIGGGEIFNLAIEHENCEYIYATIVTSNYECDTYIHQHVIQDNYCLIKQGQDLNYNSIIHKFSLYQRSNNK
jgi:dihydrofolate reductase